MDRSSVYARIASGPSSLTEYARPAAATVAERQHDAQWFTDRVAGAASHARGAKVTRVRAIAIAVAVALTLAALLTLRALLQSPRFEGCGDNQLLNGAGACVDCTGGSMCGSGVCVQEGQGAQTCAQCSQDAHCAQAAHDGASGYDAAARCHEHRCTRYCEVEADCVDMAAPNNICNTAARVCAECNLDSDCNGAGQFCSDGGRCIECDASRPCPASYLCTTAGTCALQCDAEAGDYGAVMAGVCTAQGGDSGRAVCNPVTHWCAQCVPNSLAKLTGLPAGVDPGCDAGAPRCSAADGRCVACLSNDDCALGLTCLDGACVHGVSTSFSAQILGVTVGSAVQSVLHAPAALTADAAVTWASASTIDAQTKHWLFVPSPTDTTAFAVVATLTNNALVEPQFPASVAACAAATAGCDDAAGCALVAEGQCLALNARPVNRATMAFAWHVGASSAPATALTREQIAAAIVDAGTSPPSFYLFTAGPRFMSSDGHGALTPASTPASATLVRLAHFSMQSTTG